MTALVRAELFKLRTTRTSLAIVLSLVGLVVLVVLLSGLVEDAAPLGERQTQFQLLANGSIASAFAALVGVLSLTTEFRHGTIKPTFLAEPRRGRVLAAKLVACTTAGAVLGAGGVALSFGLGRLTMSVRGIPLVLDHRDLALALGGSVAVSALWGALGLGIGAVVRNQVGAIVGLLVWSLLVESILFGLVPSVGRWLPGQAGNALVQVEVPHLLGVLPGALVLLGYAAAAALAGAAVTVRRDAA
ncbi:MAG TPA: hypothetical protein VFA82_01730 [Gaiellaceae bacterium]|nr:hypothetical protein [Gaiellaceae bacterium]